METIGRNSLVDFPELQLAQIPAKTDTGAYTSSIHCSSIEQIGPTEVRCVFLSPEYSSYTGIEHTLPIVRRVKVRSSDGQEENRFMVQTRVTVREREFDIFLTLTDRKEMKFPVLLGRRFLAGKYLVDVTLSTKQK